MSATRSSSMRALRQLSAHSHQVRHLHMTGPTTFPAAAVASEKSMKMPKEAKPTRTSGMKRATPASQHENSNAAASRTMVTAHAPVRPQPLAHTTQPQKSVREINTSRTLHSPKDTSTMDFAYLPNTPAPVPMDNVNMVRMPLTPDAIVPTRTGPRLTAQAAPIEVMRPQVVTAAGEGTHVSAPSAMSDLSDNTSVRVDYSALAEKMEQTASTISEKASGAQGTVKQLWSGMVDDIFGPKKALT